MSARLDLIALSLLPSWRLRVVAEQWRNGLSALEILQSQCADGLRGRMAPPPWTNPQWVLKRAAEAADRGTQAGLCAVGFDDDRYPDRLRHIADPPPVLWVAGQPAALADPAVAIVGSRAGSTYALDVAGRLAADLADHGIPVVSGLARGVDSAAHRGALSAAGVTVAVLGCGADVIYPPEHAGLAADILRQGAIVSELAPGTVPKPGFFPRRNRIISGLVRAVVVIEAGERSGSLITARCALEQGRDVLAVPGNVLSGRNRGGHALLRDGARLVETADDIMEELGLTSSGQPGQAAGPAAADPVLDALADGEGADLEQISERSGLPAAQLLPRLMELELRGALRRESGGRFVRFDRTC
ncbi:MAG TPA: DNA-processing protein DprA [Vicinamibacterales bacterium]|nr:DNA-processing protein DprA [Vicinamibacterales bacterium]